VSFEANAANIDCSTDLITGTLGSFSGSLYGSCVFNSGSTYIGILETGGTLYAGVQNTVSPAAPTPARNLGLPMGNDIVDMGTTEPTYTSCVGATYSSNFAIATANHWYCLKFTGNTDTGYMYAKWTGTAFSLPSVPSTPISAPSGLNLNDHVEIFATEIELK